MSEATIKAKRLAYVRVSAPDLAEATAFLDEFGLRVAARAGDTLYLRGTDAEAPCYVLSKGSGGVTAIAFEADSVDDLHAISEIDGASAIEELDGPSGGKLVRLVDPQGMQVEIVHGRTALEAIDPAPGHAFNMNGRRDRTGAFPAVRRGPSQVRRIGHLVLESADPASVYEWYKRHLGLQASDFVRGPNNSVQMIFSRLDRGSEYVDHHVVGFQFALDEGARVQHVAFEVGNLDDLMSGHDHLKSRRRKHVWSVGRHRLGGQIFDYWSGPFGVIHEHWTDTDLVNESHEPQECGVADVNDYWGPRPTPAFVIARWNWKVIRNIARLFRSGIRRSS